MEYSKKFNAKKVKDECVQWIKDWFAVNGPDCNAVIGISGGKDSTIAAALCVEALGKDKVIGVLMPNGHKQDKETKISIRIAKYLGINYYLLDISDSINAINGSIRIQLSEQAKTNLPARVRMCTLYAIAQSVNGRVVNTCNKSEDWIGYATIFGDAAGDFSPLSNLLVREVKAIGYELGLPAEFIEKTPEDGLCGKSDEDNLGFTYDMLDAYIGDGIEPPLNIKDKIDKLHKQNLFKMKRMDAFKSIHIIHKYDFNQKV